LKQNLKLPKAIFTTGLSGFIGKNLLPKLLNKYDQVVNFERDNKVSIYDKSHKKLASLSKELINRFDANTLIHLATLYKPNTKCQNDLDEILQSNVNFIINIIENYLHKENIEIINISSYMQLLNSKYQNSYSLSKEMVNIFLKENNYIHKNIFLFDSFGNGDTRNKVTDTFIKKIISNEEIKIPTDDVLINLSYVDDICHSIMCSMSLPEGSYSVMSENSITLHKLAETIMNILSIQVQVKRLGIGINYLNKIQNIPENIYKQDLVISFEERLKERINEIQQA